MTITQAPYLKGLNERQAQAVSAHRHQAVQVMAGAGTGKTELIARRFVKICQDLKDEGLEQPASRILVLTFTDAAAASMRGRIANRLVESGVSDSLPANDWISTFHTFCHRLLVKHALEAGLASDFTILDELEKRIICRRILTAIQSGDFQDISPVLQRSNLADVPGDILSPAGLRRLRLDDTISLLERIPRLIDRIKASGLSPAEFLETARHQSQGLTAQLKALPIRHLYSNEPFDSLFEFCQVLQDRLSPWASPKWDPTQVDTDGEDPRDTHYKKNLEFLLDFKPRLYLEYSRKGKKYLPVGEQDFTKVDQADAREQVLCQLIAAYYAVYQHTLQLQNSCDFDDLINRTIGLLQQNPALQAHYHLMFQAIIVDEFQDTNGSQLRLLRLLMRPENPGITVVGDEKQSIYGFRFAQPENMHLIFHGYPLEQIALKTNYRSQAPILSAANAMTLLLCRGDQTQCLEPPPREQDVSPPPVTWITLGIEQMGEDGKPRKEPISVLKDREARWIAQEIARLVNGGEYRYRDIAVLVKSHGKAQLIQEALEQLSIPVVRAKNTGFFHTPCIKDAMALMRLMVNLDDEPALVRLMQAKLNQRQLFLLARARKERQSTLYQLLEQLDDPTICPEIQGTVRQALGNLAAELAGVYRLRNRLSPVQLFLKLTERIGLLHHGMPEPQRLQGRRNLRIFEKLLYHLCSVSFVQPSLREVVDMLSSYQSNPDMELPVQEESTQENGVQLMTIHGSKGLEYPVVFVAYTEAEQKRGGDPVLLFDPQYDGKAGFGLILGRYQNEPTLKAGVYKSVWRDPRQEEEQQRLFYVALTRARERLYVLRCRQSPQWTQVPSLGDGMLVHYCENEPEHHGFFKQYFPARKPPTEP